MNKVYKRKLYESIMKNVAKEVKKYLNENNAFIDEDDTADTYIFNGEKYTNVEMYQEALSYLIDVLERRNEGFEDEPDRLFTNIGMSYSELYEEFVYGSGINEADATVLIDYIRDNDDKLNEDLEEWAKEYYEL